MIHYPLSRIEFSWEVAGHPHLAPLVPGATYYGTPYTIRRIRAIEKGIGKPITASIRQSIYPARLWNGDDLNDRRVGYYRSGHIGDALADTAALAALKWRYPRAQFYVYAESPATQIWLGNRDIAHHRARPLNLAFTEAEIRSMDYWILPRPLPFLRRTTGVNYYEHLAESLGIPIPICRPYVQSTEATRKAVGEWFRQHSQGAERFVLVQLTASEVSRTPTDWHARLLALTEAMPEHHFVCIGHVEGLPDLEAAVRRQPLPSSAMGRILWALTTQREGHQSLTITSLLELARTADLVITPDSFSLHAAAAWDTPCLALWNDRGTSDERIPSPRSRIKTYPATRWLSMYRPAADVAQAAITMLQY